MSRSIELGRSGRQDWTAFSRSRRKYFSTVWLIRRDSCAASPSVSIRNQALPFGASQTYCISLVPRFPQFYGGGPEKTNMRFAPVYNAARSYDRKLGCNTARRLPE